MISLTWTVLTFGAVVCNAYKINDQDDYECYPPTLSRAWTYVSKHLFRN